MLDTVEIVDAVAADLEAVVGLPAHRSWKYVEPRALRLELAPWLAVYPEREDPELLSTTSEYQHELTLRVTWNVDVSIGADANVQDQERGKAGLQTAQLLVARMETYGAGVPGLDGSAVLVNVEYDFVTGMLWQMRAELQVESF